MKHYKKELDTKHFDAWAETLPDKTIKVTVQGKEDSITCQSGILSQLYKCVKAFYPEYKRPIWGTMHCGVHASCILIPNEQE